jgi:hypothetical protein
VAMTAPDLPAWLHYQQVSYECTFGQTSAASGQVIFTCPEPVLFIFSFDTGKQQPDANVDLINVTWDYSWFDQATSEAGIVTALGGICTDIAALVGTTTAAVEATVQVHRVWTIEASQLGSAAPEQFSGATVTEVMPYPPP